MVKLVNFNCYESAAEYFKPEKTRLLFLAEAPPLPHPPSPERYFYYLDVKTNDWLWIGLMKAIYGEEFGEVKKERSRKFDWLKRFQSDGYRLIDAVKEPFCPNCSEARKKRIIKCRLDKIVDEILKIDPDQILLVSVTVYCALYRDLENSGLPVVKAKLSFPNRHWQKRFLCEFGDLVESGKITLTHLSQ